MNPSALIRLATMLLLAALLAGCATQQTTQQTTLTDPARDPWEGYNRSMYTFNNSLDRAVFRPVAKGYDAVMPDGPQRGVRNFFRNLGYPVTLLNSLLQGNMERAFTSTGRFLMNSSIGVLGFFDVASKAGIPYYDEDFGQTLATWGWKDSRYLVMPVLGPFTVRDLLGRSFHGYAHPINWAIREHDQYIPLIVDLVSLRAELLPLQAEFDAAADPYVLIRDVYLQRREYEIYNGDPPAPDYDA
ncbi:MAG: MlaA family lipoprotein, partial [Lysobacterales bacterium]